MATKKQQSPAPEVPEQDKTPDVLDSMMHTVEIKPWIAVGTIVLVLAAVVIWGFFGTMQLREDVSGVLVRSGRTIDIYAKADGTVLDVAVDTGTYVHKDQVIARIEQTELVDKINLMLAEDASQAEVEIARQALINATQVLTYDAGRATDVYVQSGDLVKKGDKLATIVVGAEADRSLECLLFVPMNQMKNIRKGQTVNVYPAGVNKKTYGNMTGTVTFISEFPVTERYLHTTLGSEELAKSFLGDTAHYEVALVLDVSADTATGFLWTTSEGPANPFGDLTLCDATIIVDELRPIDVFLLGK